MINCLELLKTIIFKINPINDDILIYFLIKKLTTNYIQNSTTNL